MNDSLKEALERIKEIELENNLLREENRQAKRIHVMWQDSLLKLKEAQKELKLNELKLIDARNRAEEASQAKSEFLSRMSHELRTPMNAILGFGQILEMDVDGLSEIQRENVKEILIAGRHLLELINDMLDMSRIESGKMEISMEEVKLDDLLQQCLVLIGPAAKERRLEIVDHISGKGHTVRADYTRLKQALLNLLSNAVKYNREQGRIILDSETMDNQRLRIRVTDTGRGLTEEERDRLFIPFERLNISSNVEGVGIGLVISRRLVELMGGTVGVESSALGEGSTFWVELALSTR